MPNILIVDNGSPMTSWLIETLMQGNYQVEVALDHQATLTLYDKYRHDLIVTDLAAPERREMIRDLLKQFREALVLAIVGEEPVEYDSALNAAITFGSVRIVRQPFSPKFLLQAVEEHLS
jgi:DNA-binding response OmpR family regulator